MITPIRSILHRTNNSSSGRKLNILTSPTHEGYEPSLCKTGHNFYAISGPGIKEWHNKYRPVPPNYYIYKSDFYQKSDIVFDLILAQERNGQLQRALELQKRWDIPVVEIVHTEVPPGLPPFIHDEIMKLRANRTVFITEHNKKSWNAQDYGEVIPHGIDTDIFQGWHGSQLHGVSIVNLYMERNIFTGFDIWAEIAKSGVKLEVIGDNPKMNIKPISDTALLNASLASARFFLNTSVLSPIPLSLLEAAACGCPIISTANQEVPKVFTHGENALLSNDPKELITFCNTLLKDKNEAKRLGDNARKLVLEKYPLSTFVDKWNKVFTETYEGHR